jgi:hypothetical protein
VHIDIVREFLVDVSKRRRFRHTVSYREAQTMGLLWPVVRVLAEKDDPSFSKRGQVQSGKHFRLRRVDLMLRTFMLDERHQV